MMNQVKKPAAVNRLELNYTATEIKEIAAYYRDTAKCEWKEDDNGTWETECGSAFVLEAETPSKNGMEYCPYCGNILKEFPFQYHDNDLSSLDLDAAK